MSHVALAIMAKCTPEQLKRAVDSAKHMIDSIVVLIAPRDYGCLPADGLALETRVVEAPWRGFAPTRTLLLQCTEADPKVDWVLMLDADDVFAPGSSLPDLELAHRLGVHAYQIPVEVRGYGWRWRWMRNGHLMAARHGFDWVGTGDSDRHEVMRIPQDKFVMRHDRLVYSNVFDPREHERVTLAADKLEGPHPPQTRAGARTYDADVESFRKRSEGLPLDTRSAFYYAQSLKDAGRYAEAFTAFAHRARMIGGFQEETFWSKLWLARLAPLVDRNPVPLFLDAHKHSPTRAEPLSALSAYYREHPDHRDDELAIRYGKLAHACAYPTNATFIVDVDAYHPDALRAAGIQP